MCSETVFWTSLNAVIYTWPKTIFIRTKINKEAQVSSKFLPRCSKSWTSYSQRINESFVTYYEISKNSTYMLVLHFSLGLCGHVLSRFLFLVELSLSEWVTGFLSSRKKPVAKRSTNTVNWEVLFLFFGVKLKFII